MENASKALMIAGGVIFTILVISLLLYTVTSIQEFQVNQERAVEADRLAEFNLQYTNYARDDVRGYDLLSLVNKVIDYNQRLSEAGAETNHAAGNFMQAEPISLNIKLDISDADYTNRNKLTGEILVPAVAKKTVGVIPGTETERYSDIKDDPTKRSQPEITYNKDIVNFNAQYRLFKEAEYNQNDTVNQFQDTVLNVIYGYTDAGGTYHPGLEDDFGGSINAQNLVKTVSTIFAGKVINYNGQPEDDWDRPDWFQEEYIERRYKTITGKNKDIDDIRSEANVKKILQYYEFVEFKKAEFRCTGMTYNQDTGRVASLSFEMK